MSKALLLILVIILSSCSNEDANTQNNISIKTNKSQPLVKAEKEIVDSLYTAMSNTESTQFYTPNIEGYNLQGLYIYFDLCLSDEFGNTHENCDYTIRITREFQHCPIAIRDGDCDAEDEEYSYSLGFLNNAIYINNRTYTLTWPTYYAMILTDESKKCSSLLMLPPRTETVDAGESKSYEDLEAKLKYTNLCKLESTD